MRLFGIIGFPLGHSFSKNYFTEKFVRENILDCAYENFPLSSITALPDLLRAHPDLSGFNVTIPYKEQVLPYLDTVSADVQSIGACNCVRIVDGKTVGYNTDVIGFKRSLLKSFPEIPEKALILGTGGAAKAVEFVLRKLHISFSYVSRTPQAGQLAYAELSADILSDHLLIINTTPLGMHPLEYQYPPIPYEHLGQRHCLFDLIYNPAKTAFLKKGEAAGAQIQNGMDMLHIQAEENWKIWNE